MYRFIALLFFVIGSSSGYAWNAAGHKLVAQIAYDNLTPAAKHRCSTLFNLPDKSLEPYFIKSSVWLDEIRKSKTHQFDTLHYIDIPFSKDKSKLPPIKPRNALWAIKQAILVLSSNKSSTASKTLYLKILIHVVGDIHQPLHAATKVSRRLPKGDLGGNLYLLSKSPVGKNLHQYWDKGAGKLTNHVLKNIKREAHLLEIKWSCGAANKQKNPDEWLIGTHALARTYAYAIRTHKKPNSNYQHTARTISQQ
jgi:hypothetical protein